MVLASRVIEEALLNAEALRKEAKVVGSRTIVSSLPIIRSVDNAIVARRFLGTLTMQGRSRERKCTILGVQSAWIAWW